MGDPVVHFEIGGRDGAALGRFYGELFGWQVEPVESSGGAYSMLRTDAGEGIDGGLGAFQGVPPYVAFYVRVADLADALRRAQELGATTVMEPREAAPGLSVAMFSDPEGHMIGLMQAGGGS